ncbi:MAG: XisI protein [Candidatus Parabeggiatoa sp. nov. 1]|nr:MAG: XisI protein [Gammaproteobacteria bacterium]
MDIDHGYSSLVKQALASYASLLAKFPSSSYDVILAFDDEHHQYLLRKLGWTDSSRLKQTVLHIAIRNGKIWIEEDWTEDGIASYFISHDVPREDIVLGFQPPIMRPYTEFAVE